VNDEFWLGNENIHQLTLQAPLMLRVDLVAYDGQTAYASYNRFSLASDGLDYKLQINEYDHTSSAGR